MEINNIKNFFRLQNTVDPTRVNKTAAELKSETFEPRGKDRVAISPEANFKAELSSYAKVYAKNLEVSSERLEELKAAYAGDNCPVSGRDIAASVIRHVLGTDPGEEGDK